MFEDLLKALQQQVADRVVSPLIGAFSVSWALWNYKFILIVLSEEPVRRSFGLIDELAYPHWWSVAVIGLLGPLSTALLYIFAYPYPAKLVYQFTRQRQRELLELKRRIEEETPLTIEESRRIRLEASRLEQSFYDQLERKEREIDRLKDELRLAGDTLIPAQQAAHDDEAMAIEDVGPVVDRSHVTESQIGLLEIIGEESSVVRSKLSFQGRTRLETDFDLGELEGKGFISRSTARTAAGTVAVYQITQDGRRVVLAAKASAS